MFARLFLLLRLEMLAMLALCLSQRVCFGQERMPHLLSPVDTKSCVFAGQEASFAYVPTDMREGNWQVEWSLITEHRTLRRGTSNAMTAPDMDVPRYLTKIPMPPLRDGVVLTVQLQMQWSAEGRAYQHARPLHIFSRNPFSTRQAFLENAQIKLFDTNGETAKRLDEHEIPHSRLLNLSAIDLVTEGIILVGEGVSFCEQPKLPKALLLAAHRGVRIICLAPTEGEFPLTALILEDGGQIVRPGRLSVDRADVVQRYDKRFDLLARSYSLSLESFNKFVIDTDPSPDRPPGTTWSWLELGFPAEKSSNPPGKLIVCCLSLVSQWDASPVPRYLFLRLLEEFTSTQPVLEKSDEFIQK